MLTQHVGVAIQNISVSTAVVMSSVDELLQIVPDPTSKWKENEYAVYRYSPNKTMESEGKSPGAGFSLSLVGSSIPPDREHLLREQVATKMSQGSLYPSNGQVTTLDPELFPPPSQTYYCLIDTRQSGLTREASPSDGDVSKQFLLCFVSIGKQGLDLFRTELDSYSAELKPFLQELSSDNGFSGSRLEAEIKEWFSKNVSYLSRVIQLCHNQLPLLLHTAVNSEVEVTGENSDTARDLRQFLEACSLANLMQFGSSEAGGAGVSVVKEAGCQGDPALTHPRSSITINVTESGCTVSSRESSQFCSNWAQVLLAQGTSSPDPFFLRQAVENYKLKIIQDINALKRLLRQAETDYHALYRSYVFLCACGNGKLLLQCAVQEARTLPSPETLSVLQALQSFSDKHGFKTLKI